MLHYLYTHTDTSIPKDFCISYYGQTSKDMDGISYASSSHRNHSHHHHHTRRKSVVGLPYPPEGIGPPGTTYNLWTRDSFDHHRKFNRSLCGVLLGISIVLVILGILGIIGIAVYLGVVQKGDPNGKDVLSIDGAFRVTSDDFSISLLNPETFEYKRKASQYSSMISKTFEKSGVGQAFLTTTIAGFSSGSVRVFFTITFDRRYIPNIMRENFLANLKRIVSEEVASIDGGEFKGLEIDYSSIGFTKSSKPGDEIQFFRPEPFLSIEPVHVEERHDDAESSEASLWQSLVNGNQMHPKSVIQVPFSTPSSTTTTQKTSTPSQIVNNQMNLLNSRRKIILSPNRHPIEILTGGKLPEHPYSKSYGDFPKENNNKSTRKETVILNHPRRNKPTYLFRPNAIPINGETSHTRTGMYFGNNRRIDENDPEGQDDALSNKNASAIKTNGFWDTFKQAKGPSRITLLSNEDKANEDKFQRLLSQQYSNIYSPPVVVSTSVSSTTLPSHSTVTPKIKFENFGSSDFKIISPKSQTYDKSRLRPISIINSGSSGLHVVEKSIPRKRKQDQISIGSSFKVMGDDHPNTFVNRDSNRPYQSIFKRKPVPQTIKPVMVTPHGQRLADSQPSYTTPVPIRVTTKKSKKSIAHVTPGPGNYLPPVDKTPHHLKGIPDSGQQLIKHFLQDQRKKSELDRQRNLFIQKKEEEVKTKQQQLLQEKKLNEKSSVPQILEYSQINEPIFRPSATPKQSLPLITPLPPTPKIPKKMFPSLAPATRRPLVPIRRQDLLGNIPAVGSLSAGLTPLGIFSNLLNVYATIDSKHDITGKILDSATAIFGRENPEVQPNEGASLLNNAPSFPSSTTTTMPTTTSTATTTTASSTTTTLYTTTTTTTTPISYINLVKSNVNPDLPLRPKPPSEDLSQIPPRPYGSYHSFFNNHMNDQQYIYGMNNPLYFSAETTTTRPSYGPKDFIVETVTIDSAILQDFFTSRPTLLNGKGTSHLVKESRHSPKERNGDFGESLLSKLREMVNNQSRGGSTERSSVSIGSTPKSASSSLKNIVTSKFKRYHIPPEIKITSDFSLSRFS
ncbi:uncharacterized protein [Lepeophtheirus salmonis]|uniref:uncharacterized protein isoform X2 n=1 Tax=Lepeophtheirus salmonis TaxID=72036 RepID=UPI001AE9079F|nr:uncharacterized protein LOC121121769 isoform X2 [Lepeophtheirus salmonis]